MSLELLAPIEALRAVEPVLGWRAWALGGRRDGSEPRLRPITGRGRAWPPRRPAEATCGLARLHGAPNLHCSCGLHAATDPEALRRAKDPAVVGTVALWGTVIEHARGYRARFAYPQRLRLVCTFCFWRWGLARSRADVVGLLPRGRLVPLCRDHAALSRRYGLVPRHLLDARAVLQELLAAYAVDPLPV